MPAIWSRKPSMMMFGGVPIGVRTPPMEHAYAVMSMRPVAYLYSCSSIVLPFAANISLIASNRPRAIGNIMAAVAVLLTQPEHSAQARPTARKMRLGFEPTQDIDRRAKANFRSSPCIIMPLAMMKPPMKRKIMGFANAA